jgi:hypothetical protein
MEHEFELTFEWPNGDWTWIYYQARDFHDAMLEALKQCDVGCRVKSVVRSPDGFKRGRRIAMVEPLSDHERAHFAGGVMPVGGKR